MKLLAYLLLIVSLVYMVDAAIEQYTGRAKALSPSRRAETVHASRADKPEEFKSIMAYQWIRAFAVFGAGYFLLSCVRNADKLDPFSTSE